MKKTNRGFSIYSEFTDTYGNQIIVQESSAIVPRCWVFTHNKNGKYGEYDSATSSWISATPHLSPVQARRLAKALLKFANNSK